MFQPRTIPFEKAASFFVGLKSFGGPTREDDALMAECVKQAHADLAGRSAPTAEESPADLSTAAEPTPGAREVREPMSKAAASRRFRMLAALYKTAGDEGPASVEDSQQTLSSPTPAAVAPQAEYLQNEAQGRAAEDSSALAYYQQQLEQARASSAESQEQANELQGQVEQLTQQIEEHETQMSGAQQEGQLAQQAAMQQVDTANMAATQAMQQAVDASNKALQAKGQEAAAKIEVQGVRSQLFDMASEGLPGTQPELGGEGGAAEGMQPLEPSATTEEAAAQELGAEEAAAGGEAPAEESEGGEEAAGGETADSGMNQAGESQSADGMPGQEGATESAAAAQPNSVQPATDTGGAGGGGAGSNPQGASDGEAAGKPDETAKRQGQISIKVGSVTRALLGQTSHKLQEHANDAMRGLSMAGQKAIEAAHDDRALVGKVRGAAAGAAAGAAGGFAAGRMGHGSSEDRRAKLASRLPGLFKTAGLNDKTVGMLAGGALGAGAAGLEASGHGQDLGKIREGIADREAAPARGGVRGFADAVSLVKEKARLGLGEATQNHPIPATIAGGLIGAGVGHSAGPKIGELLREAVQHHKGA